MTPDLETISAIARNFAAVVTPFVAVYGARQTRKIGRAVEQRNLRKRPKTLTIHTWTDWAEPMLTKVQE